MLKKIFIIIIAILLIAAGIVSYFAFFSPKKPDTSNGGFSITDLFPFGDNGISKDNPTTPVPPTQEPPTNETPEPTKPPKLFMINKGPVAGSFVFDVTREKKQDPNAKGPDGKPLPIQTEPATKVRYVEVATGNTDETYLDLLDIKKLTSTVIPKITEAFFVGKAGTSALLRYAEDDNIIQTFSGSIPLLPEKNGTPDTTLRGGYLSDNLTAIAVSPDKEKIFSIEKTDTGSVGTISLPDGTKKNQIFSLSFSEWATEWPNIKFITLTTKPSSKVPGYYYTVDVTTKSMKKILGSVLGLTTLTSPDMKTVLLSRSTNGTVVTSLYDIQAKSTLPLPGATTLPEKCVFQSATILYCAVPSFMPNAEYPDAWYQGGVSFVDQIYKIDIKNYSSVVIGSPSSVGASIDAINLSVDPSNTYLIFTNKKDGSLWGLNLSTE